MPNVVGRPAGKRSNACNYCRLKKIKCNGGPKCLNCLSHNEECIFPPPQRRNRNSLRQENKLLMERLAKMEAFARKSNIVQRNSPPLTSANSQTPHEVYRSPQQLREGGLEIEGSSGNSLLADRTPATDSVYDMTPFGQKTLNQPSLNRAIEFATFDIPAYTAASSTVVLQNPMENASVYSGPCKSGSDRDQNISSPQSLSEEHHGPCSFLSICSKPGVDWVSERTGGTTFTECAQALILHISRNLKLQVNRVRERAAEPDTDTAWKYCKTYFEESAEAAGGVVNRPAFEARLQVNFENDNTFNEDPAWYALRNTVYASGCLLEWSRTSDAGSFAEARTQAWRFFENALSVHTELLYSQTGVLAVEALTAMSFFVEGLGCPALEYMLCASAARLAQSKGLHLQRSKSWDLDEDEIINRNWLFWVIYSREKHIAYRSGRPSAIDDDDISCQIPTTVTTGSTINIELLTAIIKHAQIASKVSKRLATVKAYEQTPREIIQTVSEMDTVLQDWRKTLPHHFQPDTPIKYSTIPKGIHLQHILYLRYAYYGTLLAIHTIFTYPWTNAIIKTDHSTDFRNQVNLSMNIVIEASRNMILTTKHIDVDASSPVWMAFYYPFVGLINLFIYILKNPNLLSANSDVALMDIATGHFGRIEYLTSSELSFPFIREITSLSNAAVKKARNKSQTEATVESTIPISSGLMDEPMSSFGVGNTTDFGRMDMAGFDMENWSFLSQMSPADLDGTAIGVDNSF